MKIHSHTPVNATKPIQTVASTPKRTDAKSDAPFGAGVPSAGGEQPTSPNAGATTRLEAFSQKIEKRFEQAFSSKDLSPRQQQALETERDRFHSMLARYESAYLDTREGPKLGQAEGMQKLLANFGKSIAHILSGGEASNDAQAPDAPTRTPGASGSVDTIV
jgi:hypothetical protein